MDRVTSVRVLGILVFATLGACVTPDRSFPFTDFSETESIVVVGRFTSGRYLDQFPGCFDPDRICLDPPPLSLAFTVDEHVFGGVRLSGARVATTDHFGLRSYQFRRPPTYLVRLVTDGQSFVMPRYQRVALTPDRQGELVAPLWYPEDLWFFPCEILELKREVDFRESLRSPIDDFAESDINDYPDYYRVDAESYEPRYGIYASEIGDWLERNGGLAANTRCEL